jgi:nitroimidazol reductase NimA-like FMN-containing flavoprotein (pyridoxamine 5'-phosphate oxidase superfamily)
VGSSTTERSTPDQGWRGKIGDIAADELDEYLGRGLLCRLAVLDDKGWPYVQPVWFTWDPSEQVIWIIARERSAWATFMKNDGRVAMTIDEDTRPYRKVSLQGIAEVVEEPNVGGRWVPIAKVMANRYLGEFGEDYITPTLDKPRWLFKIRPTEMATWQGVAWASRYRE